MEKNILRLLRENARMPFAEIAERLGTDEETVRAAVKKLEDEQVILGYTAVVNEDRLPDAKVRALIEVKVTPRRDGGFDEVARRIARFPEVVRLYLASGGYDLLLEVEGASLQEVAGFVSARLFTLVFEWAFMAIFVDVLGYDHIIRVGFTRLVDGADVGSFALNVREFYIFKFIATVIVTVLNYVFSKLLIFNGNSPILRRIGGKLNEGGEDEES